MDSLQYKYYYGTNKLKQVTDAIDTGWYKVDLDNEPDSNNYCYDKIGNLISDKLNNISSITWNVYGKIKSVVRTSGSTKANLYFSYAPDGNRIMKLIRQNNKITYFYYVRDAQGNIMAVYKRTSSKPSSTIYDSTTLVENDLYGSSRLGIVKEEKLIHRFNYTGSLDTVSGKPTVSTTLLDTNQHYSDSLFSHVLGQKRYELQNHLGNVLATVSDRKLQHSTNGTTRDYYSPDIITAYDYYAFGASMPGRTWSIDSVKQASDSCLPCSILKHIMESYTGPDLNDSTAVKNYLNSHVTGFGTLSANQWLTILESCNLVRTTSNETSIESIHKGNFGPSDQLPNTPQNPSDDSYSIYLNYYFDSTSCSGGNAICKVIWIKVRDQYIYGFDNQRKENEINGEGIDYTAEFWEYDSRLGRRWNIDPKPNPSLSPYCTLENSPFSSKDEKGDTAWKATNKWNDDFIKKYQSFVAKKIDEYRKNNDHYSCEDLALSLLVDFASENKLPLAIETGSGKFTNNDANINNPEQFRNTVDVHAGASDVGNDKNTVKVNGSFTSGLAGDLIMTKWRNNENGHNAGIAHHIQVITWATSWGYGMAQGDEPGWYHNAKLYHDYLGGKYSKVQLLFYDFKADLYKNYFKNTQQTDFSKGDKESYRELRRWNFMKFNNQ
jgi:hypothetical protein